MIVSVLIQLGASLVGSLCFGILFNMRGKRLVAGAVGGLMSWGLFLLMSRIISSESINYFIVAAVISLYSEIMARLLKTPAAFIVTISLIPLIPGGSLYYTMASVFQNDFDRFIKNAMNTLKLASALALGVIMVTAISHLLFKRKNRPHSS